MFIPLCCLGQAGLGCGPFLSVCTVDCASLIFSLLAVVSKKKKKLFECCGGLLPLSTSGFWPVVNRSLSPHMNDQEVIKLFHQLMFVVMWNCSTSLMPAPCSLQFLAGFPVFKCVTPMHLFFSLKYRSFFFFQKVLLLHFAIEFFLVALASISMPFKELLGIG